LTLGTFWLGRLCAAFSALTVFAIGFEWFGAPSSSGRVALRAHLGRLNAKLRLLRSGARAEQVVIGQAVAAAATIVFVLLRGNWLLLLLLPAVVFAPRVVLEQRIARRIGKLEEQVESWLNAVANALKASPSLGEAIASSTALVPAPMSQEIDMLVKEYELGTPLDLALDNLAARIGSSTVSGTVLALKVARKSGGNLPEMLEGAAAALRELARLEGVVRTKTAEGKAQAFVIGMIPVPMVIGMNSMDPHFFEPLARSFMGNLIVAGVCVLWAAAVLSARKILDVDV
jgi:tight adherence protein B